MHRRLGWAIAVLLACDLAVVLTSWLRPASEGSPALAKPAPTSVVTVLPAGQAVVTGTVRALVGDDVVGQPLALPVTLVAVARGTASVTIEQAIVASGRATISWDGGTPLPIDGRGALDLGPAHLALAASGLTWTLDGPPRTFVPGVYGAGAPVALGRAGLATPRDSVQFVADAQTILLARGGVVVHEAVHDLSLRGPGRLQLAGSFRVRTRDGERAATSLRFGPGPLEVTLTARSGAVAIDATLQGPLVTG